MDDYIKREVAINTFDSFLDALSTVKKKLPYDREEIGGKISGVCQCKEIVRMIPSADVAPVRHGRWKDEFKEDAEAFVKHRYVCTVCGEWQTYGKTQYCPNCGAKMDEGGNDGTDNK